MFSFPPLPFSKLQNLEDVAYTWKILNRFQASRLHRRRFSKFRMAVQVELFGKSFEFDSDHEQPFFFHPDPGLYNVTVPTSDIWKKIELRLLTPPRSPPRCESPKQKYENTSVADTLQIVSEILDDTCASPTILAPVDSTNTGNLKSKLIQDCMWNCSNFDNLDFKVPIEECYETPCSTPPPIEYDSSDCVDPAAVFPYPINDTSTSIASSTSDSEEEIDVVTIEKPKRKPVNTTVNQPPPPKRLRPALTRQKSTGSVQTSSKQTKKMERLSSGEEEEVEDIESKRATHNVLERKRRNDLKFSFHTLRNELPEVRENERAPKVMILREGADYIKKLRNEEVKRLAELERLRKRNEELLEKQIQLLGRKRKQY